MTSGGTDDAYWRRPAHPPTETPLARPGSTPEPSPPPYTGPPPTTPPPPGWRPPVVVQTPPPRALPEQDHGRLDVEEQAARTVTTGMALVAAAVLVVLVLVLCIRGLF